MIKELNHISEALPGLRFVEDPPRLLRTPLHEEPIAYIISLNYQNWRNVWPSVRGDLENGRGSIMLFWNYQNLCSTYGKKTVDSVMLDVYDIKIHKFLEEV